MGTRKAEGKCWNFTQVYRMKQNKKYDTAFVK